jgi:hypothetical protein
VIDCVTDRVDGGLREPLFLAGDFAVHRGPLPVLQPPLTHGQWEDYDANGLPWYAGVIEYQTTLAIEVLPPGDEFLVDLELPAVGGPGLTLSCNDSPWHAVPWRPQRLLLPRTELKVGNNNLRLRVHGDLLRAYESQRWNEAEHRIQPLPPPSPEAAETP